MNKELVDAFETLSTKLRGYKEHFDSLSADTEILENKKGVLLREVESIENSISKLHLERSDLQFLIDAKKKEDEMKIAALKQGYEELAKRLDIVELREKNLDNRETRIKDRETMYGIKK